jgi:hypothetical protein
MDESTQLDINIVARYDMIGQCQPLQTGSKILTECRLAAT